MLGLSVLAWAIPANNSAKTVTVSLVIFIIPASLKNKWLTSLTA
jgi:hypothetical protein